MSAVRETSIDQTAPELARYVKDLHFALVGRPCPVAEPTLIDEIGRTLSALEPQGGGSGA